MAKSGCEFDFSDVERAFDSFEADLISVERKVGREAVDYAREHGDYRDVTGRLHRSTRFQADALGLTIYSEAPYASDVEARGKDVISGAALFAEQRLREEASR